MDENAENAPAGARCTSPVFQKIVACFVKLWLHLSRFSLRCAGISQDLTSVLPCHQCAWISQNLCKELIGIAHAGWS